MSNEHLLVGVASRIITPPLGCDLAGFDARKGVATAIHDDLFARALVLASPVQSIVIVSLDLIGISQELTNAVRRTIHASQGVAPRDIILTATHTHCGPVTIKHFFNADQPLDAKYMERLEAIIVEAIEEAFANAVPAVINAGLVPVSGVASNRRTESGRPIDPFAGVLLIESLAGEVRALLVNFPCHPTVLGPNTLEVTRDFPHYFAERVRERLGADVTPIYINGTEGDLSIGHKSYLSAVGIVAPFRTFEKAKEVGVRLAECVFAGLGSLVVEEPILGSRHAVVALPLKPYPPREEMQRKKEAALAAVTALTADSTQADVIARRQDWLFARIEAYYSLLYAQSEGDPFLRVEVSGVRVGGTAIVFVPGEVFVEIGLAIRERSPFQRTMIFGLANDYIGYVPTVGQSSEWGYEVVASRVTPEASIVLEAESAALLEEIYGLDVIM
jgi:hypothetical protein